MTDPLGLSEGVKSLTGGLNSAREASKSLTKSIEGIQKDGLDVAQQKARERITARREAELKKERALIRALQKWQHDKLISDEEAKIKIDFISCI